MDLAARATGGQLQEQPGEAVQARKPTPRFDRELHALLQGCVEKATAQRAATPVWWPAYCARCCERGREDLTEPWCESCGKTHWLEYAPVFKAWAYRNRQRYMQLARVPPAFQLCGFDNFEARTVDQQRAMRVVTEWCAGDSGGLFLHGAVGTGKTHLAMAALLEKLATKKRGRFVAMRELILECRESFRRERLLSGILDELTNHEDYLVLDDFGAEKPSEFAKETLELLIDRSYAGRQWQPIVTSNLDLDQLSRSAGERIADRLRERCVTLRLGGASYRRKIAARRAWQAKGEGGQNL
jgi:DNA replication protein DnaC